VMKYLLVCLLIIANLPGAAVSATFSPNREAMYHRIICVVPIVGSGTAKDPKRPLFTPLGPGGSALPPINAKAKVQPDRRIIASQSVPADDGNSVIVMFVARNYEAFQPILSDPRVIAKFERKEIREQDLVKALRKYKKNFEMQQLRMGAL
jgi:hypothetical protein